MGEQEQDWAAGPVKVVLILDDDVAGRGALRRTLDSLGYEARVMSDAGAALDALRTSVEPIALFFDVEARGATLDGQGYARLIGALLEDPPLAQRHVFAVISSTADDVDLTLGRTLNRLGAPVFDKPCSPHALEAYLALARGRAMEPALSPVATI